MPSNACHIICQLADVSQQGEYSPILREEKHQLAVDSPNIPVCNALQGCEGTRSAARGVCGRRGVEYQTCCSVRALSQYLPPGPPR